VKRRKELCPRPLAFLQWVNIRELHGEKGKGTAGGKRISAVFIKLSCNNASKQQQQQQQSSHLNLQCLLEASWSCRNKNTIRVDTMAEKNEEKLARSSSKKCAGEAGNSEWARIWEKSNNFMQQRRQQWLWRRWCRLF
jgi:hypothetical protein